MRKAYSHCVKSLAPSVVSWTGVGFSVALQGAVPFELSLKSFVAILIARMRLMGSWEMLLRAALAKNGRGIRGGDFDGFGQFFG
jgi:hypothetical protein